jgi:CheY-like chemotaxis protein
MTFVQRVSELHLAVLLAEQGLVVVAEQQLVLAELLELERLVVLVAMELQELLEQVQLLPFFQLMVLI